MRWRSTGPGAEQGWCCRSSSENLEGEGSSSKSAKEAVAASFRKLRDQGRTLTPGRIARVVQGALRETFEVFEGFEE